MLLQLRVDSDSEEKMGDELLEAFHKIEKAGGQATLSLSTSSGKTKVKLEIPTTAAPPSASPSPSASSAPHIAPRGAKKEEAFGGVILKSERPSGALFTNSGPPFFTVESRIEVLSLLGTSFQ